MKSPYSSHANNFSLVPGLLILLFNNSYANLICIGGYRGVRVTQISLLTGHFEKKKNF